MPGPNPHGGRGGKPSTRRVACAEGGSTSGPAVLEAILSGQVGKGDVLGVARIAAIQASKRCADLIPMSSTASQQGRRVFRGG